MCPWASHPMVVALTAGESPAGDVAGVVVGQDGSLLGQHRQLHVAVQGGRAGQAEQGDVVAAEKMQIALQRPPRIGKRGVHGGKKTFPSVLPPPPANPSPGALPCSDVVAVPVGVDDDLADAEDLLGALALVDVVVTSNHAIGLVTARKGRQHRVGFQIIIIWRVNTMRITNTRRFPQGQPSLTKRSAKTPKNCCSLSGVNLRFPSARFLVENGSF